MTDHTAHLQQPSYTEHKARIQTRLRRLEGQVRGVQRMIDEDTYCVDILTQLSAIIAAARGVGMLVLEDHIRGCVVDAPADQREDRIDELTQAIERFTRTVGG
ncbi:MAG TPA: metal-sensitive transcriptional regulator [Thermomicrobiales bacterium]|nr:metal-sensitive transcriptional regulator [Thermomicrobiales bacterium]